MNEQQRLEMSQIKQGDAADRKSGQEKPLHEKTTEDFAKYFQTTYQPPNINKARKRFRDKIEVHYDVNIPEDMRKVGECKKFLIQTYGCPMNEPHTEVMAGILAAMGYQTTPQPDDTDTILLLPSVIRENAELGVFRE